MAVAITLTDLPIAAFQESFTVCLFSFLLGVLPRFCLRVSDLAGMVSAFTLRLPLSIWPLLGPVVVFWA